MSPFQFVVVLTCFLDSGRSSSISQKSVTNISTDRISKDKIFEDEALLNPVTMYHEMKMTYDRDYKADSREKKLRQREFEGACLRLVNVQSVYQISSSDLINGLLFGQTTQPLLMEDFYIIGSVAMKHSLHVEAIPWLETAVDLMVPEETPSKDKDVHNMAKSTQEEEYMRGDSSANRETLELSQMYEIYYDLCRTNITSTAPVNSDMCQLQWNTFSYGWWHVEILHQNPLIVFFHNAISDEEIRKFDSASVTKFGHSEVMDINGDSLEHFSRMSKSAWEERPNVLTEKLEKRIEDMTGLNAAVYDENSPSEMMQTILYEPGGLYQPHLDVLGYIQNDENIPQYLRQSGDRLATFMFYLSSPKMGGATVFPKLNVHIPALKGGAVFWYNLHSNGSIDDRMLHAGCPVAIGTKRVTTKWIRQHGQACRSIDNLRH